jgi:hypothetical protein
MTEDRLQNYMVDTAKWFTSEVREESLDASLFGLFVMAHGNTTEFGSRYDFDQGSPVHYSDLEASLQYHLGLVIINACNSLSGVEELVSKNGGLYAGCEYKCNGGFWDWAAGIVYPGEPGWSDLTHPQNVIKPGQLGTKGP